MLANLGGDVTHNFINYTQQANLDLIVSAWGKTALVIPSFALSDIELERKSFYPENFVCCPCIMEGSCLHDEDRDDRDHNERH